MKARSTPRTVAIRRNTSLTCSRNTFGSSPKILMTTCPSICEMLSSTLSRMGWEKLVSTPGSASRALSISARIFPFVMPRRHSGGGFNSTKHSAMLIGLGSVPSSGRPAFEMTVFTSGTVRSNCRILAVWATASVTEMPGGRLAFNQIVPSLSSGRNSVPTRGNIARLAASAMSALRTTAQGRASALRNTGT